MIDDQGQFDYRNVFFRIIISVIVHKKKIPLSLSGDLYIQLFQHV